MQTSSKKITLMALDGVPGPGCVETRGMFDPTSPRQKAYSFGLSREHFRKVYVKENLQADDSVPGPGSYSIPTVVGREGQPVSIKGRNFSKDNGKRFYSHT